MVEHSRERSEDTLRLNEPKMLSEFQKMSHYIYGKANRRYSDVELLLRLIEEIAVVMELARKDYRDEFQIQIPRIFSWYNAVANRLDINLQDILWHKYPGVCPYCMRDRDCLCGLEHPDMPDKENILRRLRRERDEREPLSLREHQLFHKRLYGRQNARIMLFQTAAHLVEEAGEVSRAFRHGNREELCDEMADVASWIFALATRLKLDLHTTFWRRYPYECEKCHYSRCRCDQKKL